MVATGTGTTTAASSGCPRREPNAGPIKEGNWVRDERNHTALREAGWNVVVIWECAVSKKLRLHDEHLAKAISTALALIKSLTEIRG